MLELPILGVWVNLEDQWISHYTNECKREICNPEHLLYNTDFTIISKRNKRDDFIAVGNGAYYFVHLTWRQEEKKEYPTSFKFKNLDHVNYFIKHGDEQYDSYVDHQNEMAADS